MSGKRLLSLISNTTQLRLVSIVTVLWFGVIFNLERLNLGTEDAVNLNSIVYIIVALVGMGFIAFPNLQNLNPLVTGTALIVFYLGANTVFSQWEHYTSQPAYLVLEIGVLLISFVLLRTLSHLLLDLELGLNLFVMQRENPPIMSFARAKEKVEQELERASRYDRPLACIYCEVYDQSDTELQLSKLRSALGEHLGYTLKQYYQRIKLGQYIATLVFKSDMILLYRNGFLLFLLETGEEEVKTFLQELGLLVSADIRLNLLVGESYFPEDGADLDELVQKARSSVRVFLKTKSEDNAKTREGDVFVDVEQRLMIEKQSEWLNKLAYQSPTSRLIYRPIKRLMDFSAALLVLPFALVMGLLLALLVYLDDGRPIFYSQERTGYGGRRFKMYKFRSMKVGAASTPPEVIHTSDGKVRYVWPEKNDDDPRVTRVGRILRKTSLDEIPQLWNVLSGDMSLVGPRPTSWNLDKYTLLQTERLSVRPGITGLWQVSARETQNFDERLLWDVKYVEKMSLWLDIQIIWRTVSQVVGRKGV